MPESAAKRYGAKLPIIINRGAIEAFEVMGGPATAEVALILNASGRELFQKLHTRANCLSEVPLYKRQGQVFKTVLKASPDKFRQMQACR